ncbi:hypothetical protein HYS82_02735 [Candidatus Amesbacteria bacterium]|nr:hypothetical protein [Candidatus Amesbacteria bacterium]MBI2587307.1 hypothetical protein [Candidatus Amesbacteria bacterium]
MFGPKVIEEFDSKYSGKIRVMQAWGYKYVSTGYWTQSGGIIKEVWAPAFKKIHAPKNTSWLILGLATGTIAKMIPRPAKIIGVEIDPVMLAIGKKYFDLAKIPDLEIVQLDAKRYTQNTKNHFDYILVDLYCVDQLPEFVYSRKFIKKIKTIGRTTVFNHLFHTPDRKKAAEELLGIVKQYYSHIIMLRSLTNLLIICS